MLEMETDDKIVKAIQSGENQWVLNTLYVRTLPKIKTLIYKMKGSEDDALDIFQESVIILFRQIKLNKISEVINLDGFIYRVSKNLYLNKLRQANRFVEYTDRMDTSEEPEVETHMFMKESESELMSLFNKIGDKCRELLKALIFEELNYEEVALKFGFASGEVVKTQKYRCKKKLEILLEENPSLFQNLNRFAL